MQRVVHAQKDPRRDQSFSERIFQSAIGLANMINEQTKAKGS